MVKLQRLLLLIARAAGALLFLASASVAQNNSGEEVDLALVIAVDISYSMDVEEQRLQKQGYVEALNSPEVIKAIQQGMIGKIAITYFEWANSFDQRMVVPWTIIDGPASAKAVTDIIEATPIRRAQRTSVSGAINFGHKLMTEIPFRPLRKVIDVSGDGPNNSGDPVLVARDRALQAGIVINGLPILLKRGNAGWGDISNLDLYFQDCVVGGPGSFMIPITTREQFVSATRAKIIREVADLGMSDVQLVQQGSGKSDCMIGERQFRERWGN